MYNHTYMCIYIFVHIYIFIGVFIYTYIYIYIYIYLYVYINIIPIYKLFRIEKKKGSYVLQINSFTSHPSIPYIRPHASCVLQCVAVCCSVLQCVAVCCNVKIPTPHLLHCNYSLHPILYTHSQKKCTPHPVDLAPYTHILLHTHTPRQCVAVCCIVLQCVAVWCSVLQCVAVRCSVLQCVAVLCSVHPRQKFRYIYTLQEPQFDWCCFYYSTRLSIVALLAALSARMF